MEEEKRHQQPSPKYNFKAWEEPMFDDLRKLFSRAQLRSVLTHSSFYEQEGKGNSRYVFAGMFVFKGQVAEVLCRYFTGDGTRLQHVLGNLFKQERLVQLYDEWQLRQFVRAGEKFDISKHKHIFVYAIFGYVSALDENTRNWFISKYIINKDTKHFFIHRKRNRDLLAQANDIVRNTDGRSLTLVMETTDDNLYKAKAVLSDGAVLCEAVSKSWRYARTKVTKLALNMLAEPLRRAVLSNPDYQARVRSQIEEKKARRKVEVEEREAQKKALREEKLRQRKVEAKIRDAKRRKSQAEAKKRKAESAARAAVKAAKQAQPISAKKRQYLADKKK